MALKFAQLTEKSSVNHFLRFNYGLWTMDYGLTVDYGLSTMDYSVR